MVAFQIASLRKTLWNFKAVCLNVPNSGRQGPFREIRTEEISHYITRDNYSGIFSLAGMGQDMIIFSNLSRT